MENTPTNKTPAWSATAVPGLYLRSGGIYYTRYRMNGTRTFRSHETSSFTIAKLKHAELAGVIERARQQGAQVTSDFKSMLSLAEEFLARNAASTVADRTKMNYVNWLQRLKASWPGFDTSFARSVDMDFIIKLRNRLSGETKFRVPNTHTTRTGYRPAVVNQSLFILRMLLDIAVSKHVITSNPFSYRGVMQGSVYLTKKTRKPVLPTRDDMERIFAELARVPNLETFEEGRRKFLEQQALDSSRHARFLAYSGMRLQEANASLIEDDLGDTLRVRGTKSETSARYVPVAPALRALLTELRGNRETGRFLSVKNSLQALQRACDRLKLPRLTHHHLRHYFATVCIESGVDIPTVSRWLGHADGGALLMKTYGHLRQEHSIAASQKVSFTTGTGAQSSAA